MNISTLILRTALITFVVVFTAMALEYYARPVAAAPTPEEQAAITDEYFRLLQERNDNVRELIELYELRTLEAQGKLHSS